MPTLHPDEVTVLDPDADADSLRRTLARLARGPARDGAMTIPSQATLVTQESAREADAELYGPVHLRRGS